MITRITRPYSKSERELLRSRLPSLYKRIEDFAMKFIFILMIFFLLPFLLLDRFFHFSSNVQLITCIVFIIATVFIVLRITNKYEGGLSNKKAIADLSTAQAEEIHVKTSRAIKREDPEDFGVAFYIDVLDEGKRKSLFLWGQHLDELEDDNLFPNTEFIVTRRLDTKETIDINLSGDPFKPEKTLPAFAREIWKSGKVPADGELIDQTIDEIA